jgi:hypothetical protein
LVLPKKFKITKILRFTVLYNILHKTQSTIQFLYISAAESSISLSTLATTKKIATSQSIESNITASATTVVGTKLHSSNKPSKTTTEWVAIPVFSDIVRLAIIAREECILK